VEEQYPIYERFPSRTEIVGILIALAPFVLRFGTSYTRTVNGVVVESQSTNYVGLLLGPIAILIALRVAGLLKHTSDADRLKRIVTIVVIIAIGVLQLLSGLGLVSL
jgi:hypothetical protein